MPDDIRCPSCQRAVSAPADCYVAWLTCGGCHAIFPNPRMGRAETPPRPLPRKGPLVCPACGKPVEEVWLFCPNCEERLKDTRQGPIRTFSSSLEGKGVTVRNVLAFVGFFPFAAMVATVVMSLIAWNAGDAVPAGVALWFAGFFGALIAVARARKRDVPITVWSIFLSIFTVLGALVASGLALFIFAFILCAAGGMRC